MKRLSLLSVLLGLSACATTYQPQSFTGGFSDYMTAPDEAVVIFRGNGYTSPERVGEMAALRAAEVTLAHGYRYFVLTGLGDLSRQSLFTTPGYAHTYGSVFGYGNYGTVTANTTITPPQTFRIYKPGVTLSIKMANDQKSLEPFGAFVPALGGKARPKDAAFLSQSLRQFLGIKSTSARLTPKHRFEL